MIIEIRKKIVSISQKSLRRVSEDIADIFTHLAEIIWCLFVIYRWKHLSRLLHPHSQGRYRQANSLWRKFNNWVRCSHIIPGKCWVHRETDVSPFRLSRLLKGQFSIRTSMSQFKSFFVVINFHLVSWL